MLGKSVSLKFVDHEITDEQEFLEMAQEKYLCAKIIPGIGSILLEPHTWVTRLERLGILNLLEIFHFGQSLEINACVKMLLSCIHRGTLWIEPPVSIDKKLIAWIKIFSKVGEDLKTLFTNKAGEKTLLESMKDNLHTFLGKRGLDVENISDDVVRFYTKVLACKLWSKFHKDEVSATVIAVVEKCA
jgi:hypothetical protein